MNLNEKLRAALKNRRVMAVILATVVAAVGMLFLCMPESGSYDEKKDSFSEDLESYKLRLEDELSDICSSVDGVGRCRIMITFERGAENVYKGSQLIESTPPQVSGVTAVCDGGADNSVKGTLTEMISALFGIGKNRVAVLELKK